MYKTSESIFSYPDSLDVSYNYQANYLANIAFLVNRDVFMHEREIYGPLNFLGDVGGLADALLAIGSWSLILLEVISGSQLSHYLINSIFFLDNSYKAIG